MQSVDGMLRIEAMFGSGTDVIFVGYPCDSGSGSYPVVGTAFSVSEKTLLGEGCVEFLTYVLENMKTHSGIPMSEKRFSAEADAAKSEPHYYGDRYYTADEITDEMLRDGVVVKLDFTDRDEARLRELINNLSPLPNGYDFVRAIISEEASMYFAGDKTLDETVKIIQNRVETYVSERK